MNSNFSLPTLATLYSDFLTQMKSRDEDIATWFDGSTATNLPTGTKRWNNTGSKFEKWSGTGWTNLSTLYEIKVRDSDKLNGQGASYYAVSNHNHSAVTTTANGLMNYTDKTKLDAIADNANYYSHPTGDGNLHVPTNGTSNNGKFLQATSVAGVYSWASIPSSSLSSLGITATAAELNILDGATVSTAELNILDGVLITAAQLNYLSTLTGDVQTQLNAKAALASPALTGTPTAPTATVGTNNTQIATTAFVLANSNAVTTTTVGAAAAGIAAGGIGSYVIAFDTRAKGNTFGVTVAGSILRPAHVNANISPGSTALVGTWKCMGFSPSGETGATTLFLRIA